MTVTYTSDVASSHKFGVFWKLLLRWKGSVYKMIWPEIIVFTVIFLSLSCIYRYALSDYYKEIFEQIALYCRSYVDSIPVTFVLGFYVSLVVTRWWGQFESLPWPDNLAILVSNSIQGRDVRTRMMRRTIVRYLLDTEKNLLEATIKDANGNIYWVPLVWAVSLIESARKECYIKNDLAVQVVTLAVYSFLVATIMGRQFLENQGNRNIGTIDIFIPIFTYLQILFYLGWLKVAESLFNPFGKDDEDFDVEGLVDRNMRISYLIADKMLDSHPELQQDKHWDEVFYKQALIRTPSKKDREEENETTINLLPKDDEADFVVSP
ncbi:Bestrophin-3 [Armadillidium nasatum]|uniref:Bestrophin homolog n=1 Tax=Armadillidium nasatum TaxID=96803 RepID=A0A5N5TC90_9CRUS|nr:Bestrophin-3 [Armadillidium nasatum]